MNKRPGTVKLTSNSKSRAHTHAPSATFTNQLR